MDHLQALAADIGCCSDQGRRAANEDWVVSDGRGILVMCDGVGGAPEGARAAAIAGQAALDWLSRCRDSPVPGLLTAPVAASDALAVARPALDERAATGLAAAVVVEGLAYAVAVGDCRVVVYREDFPGRWTASSSTVDHDGLSLLARDVAASLRLGRAPELVAAEAADEASRRLLQSIRVRRPARPVAPVIVTPLSAGDLVLLSTDGVHDVLGQAGVREVLGDVDEDCTAADICRRLVDRALALGSSDNCSAAALRVRD